MILIFQSSSAVEYNLLTYCYFIKFPDNMDYNFLNNLQHCRQLNLPGKLIGEFKCELPKDVNVCDIDLKYFLIYYFYKNYKENIYSRENLYLTLKSVPIEFTKWLIEKFKTYSCVEKSIIASFEKEIDEIYNDIMIKDIIE